MCLRESGIIFHEAEEDVPEAVIRLPKGEPVTREYEIRFPESLNHLPLIKM